MNKGHLSELEQLQFFEDILQKFKDPSIKKGEFRRYYRIADTVAGLVFAGKSLLELNALKVFKKAIDRRRTSNA